MLLALQFVVSISSGRVTGILGNVYDAKGRVFSEFTPSMPGLPLSEEQVCCVCFPPSSCGRHAWLGDSLSHCPLLDNPNSCQKEQDSCGTAWLLACTCTRPGRTGLSLALLFMWPTPAAWVGEGTHARRSLWCKHHPKQAMLAMLCASTSTHDARFVAPAPCS